MAPGSRREPSGGRGSLPLAKPHGCLLYNFCGTWTAPGKEVSYPAGGALHRLLLGNDARMGGCFPAQGFKLTESALYES
jgi:hypothetical protein